MKPKGGEVVKFAGIRREGICADILSLFFFLHFSILQNGSS